MGDRCGSVTQRGAIPTLDLRISESSSDREQATKHWAAKRISERTGAVTVDGYNYYWPPGVDLPWNCAWHR